MYARTQSQAPRMQCPQSHSQRITSLPSPSPLTPSPRAVGRLCQGQRRHRPPCQSLRGGGGRGARAAAAAQALVCGCRLGLGGGRGHAPAGFDAAIPCHFSFITPPPSPSTLQNSPQTLRHPTPTPTCTSTPAFQLSAPPPTCPRVLLRRRCKLQHLRPQRASPCRGPTPPLSPPPARQDGEGGGGGGFSNFKDLD